MPGTLWKTGSMKTDRDAQLSGYGSLESLASQGQYGGGYENINQGASGLKDAQSFFHALMSGDSTKIGTVLAPQIGDITSQAEQQKKVNSEFGSRSGGTNAANQSIDANAKGQIDRLIATLTGEAAGGETSASSALGNLGLGTSSISQSAASNLASISENSYFGNKTAAREDTGGALNAALLLASLCWVAAELYGGWYDPKTVRARRWFQHHPVWMRLYIKLGPWWAQVIRRHPALRSATKLLFDRIVGR